MIVLETHRPQLLTMSAMSTAFGAAGLLVVRKDVSRLRKGWNALCASYFLLHGARLAALAMRPAALILGREGILDKVGSPPAGFLPWDRLLPAETVQVPLGLLIRKFVGVRVAGADGIEEGRWRSPLEPPLLREYALLIPEYTLEERVEEVVDIMNQFIEDASERRALESLSGAPGKALW